ncbi:MAG: hypothetical protein LLF83_02435 [Methanobacterium sp.]|nr:hypothetical protein [Methanobacterium sp.]
MPSEDPVPSDCTVLELVFVVYDTEDCVNVFPEVSSTADPVLKVTVKAKINKKVNEIFLLIFYTSIL